MQGEIAVFVDANPGQPGAETLVGKPQNLSLLLGPLGRRMITTIEDRSGVVPLTGPSGGVYDYDATSQITREYILSAWTPLTPFIGRQVLRLEQGRFSWVGNMAKLLHYRGKDPSIPSGAYLRWEKTDPTVEVPTAQGSRRKIMNTIEVVDPLVRQSIEPIAV